MGGGVVIAGVGVWAYGLIVDLHVALFHGPCHLRGGGIELRLYSLLFLVGFLLLFLLIYLFNVGKNRLPKKVVKDPKLLNFISSKKVVSLVLLFLLMITSTYSLVTWLMYVFADGYVSNVDGVFFNQFFTLLILTDVIILLISFRYTEEYSKLIRNTGFIIATILIRLSFSADGFLNIILILTGVGFALLILQIFNAMENPKLDSTA